MNPDKPIQKYKSAYLPHWRQEGATYAITYRLADSIPRHAADQLATERRQLERKLTTGELLTDDEQLRLDRLHSEKVEAYLNRCIGSCALRTPDAAKIVRDSFAHFDGQRYALHAFAIMPNHVHAVATPFEEWPLDSIVRQWKSFTARHLNKLLGRTGAFWNADYYDHLIRGPQDFTHAIEYALANPIVASLMNWPWTYVAPELRFGDSVV